MPEDVSITEFEVIDPDELHLVGNGANGFKALLAKSASEEVRAVLDDIAESIGMEIVKADDDSDDRLACPTCKGDGKIKGNSTKCPKCLGSGKAPKVGDSAKAAAPSGAEVPVGSTCPTCGGNGKLTTKNGGNGKDCPDCDGSGKDAQFPEDDKLNRVQGFGGSQDDGNGRTTVDKSANVIAKATACGCAACYYVIKAEMSGAAINDLPDSAFAYIEGGGTKDSSGKTTPRDKRHFPVHDKAHAANALSRLSQSPFGDAAKSKVVAAAKRFGIDVAEKNASNQSGGTFDEPVEKDGVVSGVNPFLGGSVSSPDDNADGAPGSPEWEACDAQMATDAAMALMQAADLIQQFAGRESVEVAAGEGNDLFDAFDAQCALDAVTCALGVMARLAFHEGVAAQKATGVAEKAGKRLSTKSITALAAARDHLTALMGDDDPAKSSDDDDDASKSQEDIENMTLDELMKALDERDARKVAEAEADETATKVAAGVSPADDHNASVANAKTANSKAKGKKPKDDNTDLEDEANQGTNDSASSPAMGAAKAAEVELTPEQIEARTNAKVAKKALKESKRAEKQAAENAALAKAIEEAVTEATKAVDSLQERLATVEKMAAPGGPVKTRPQAALNKAAERDALDIELAHCERMAKDTNDMDERKGYNERAKEVRRKLADVTTS
jgi:hypothetical protein